MKTLFTSASLLVLLCLTFLTGCKKGNDPMPNADLSARVVGNYTFSSLTTEGKTYPASDTQLAGTVNVVRESATAVTLQIDLHSKSNDPFVQGTASNLTLTDAGNNEVNLTKDGDQVAKGGNGKLVLKLTDEDDNKFDVTLTK